jgi:integrase
MRPRRTTSLFRRSDRKGIFVEYQDPDTGRPRHKTFKHKVDAEDFVEAIKAKQRAAEGMADDQRFDQYSSDWLAKSATALKRTTQATYDSLMRNHLVPTFGHLTLREITPARVKDFIIAKRQSGLSKKTVATVKGVLHSCLEHARDVDGIIQSNPATFRAKSKLLKLTATRAEKRLRKIKAMDVEQLRAFLAAAKATAPEWHPLFYTVWVAGLRIGEGLALEPRHVDIEGRTLLVEQALSNAGHLETTKSGEEATLDISPGLASSLREWLLRRAPGRWLFSAPGGSAWTHHHAEGAFKRILKAAKLSSHFTPHSLRHTCATLLLNQGKPVQYVQHHMRHANIAMTVDTYGSWLPRGNAENIAELDREILGEDAALAATGKR